MAKKKKNIRKEDTQLKGNRGEWSEPYVLFRLLGERTIFPCNKNLKESGEIFFILKIVRGEGEKKIEFEYIEEKGNEHWIVRKGNQKIATVTLAESKCEALDLLEFIKTCKNREKRAFPKSQTFLERLGCHSLKADSKSKKDIILQISDARAGTNPICGYSIKSYLGKEPTLLNASKEHTNFLYKVSGLDSSRIDYCRSLAGAKLMEALIKENATLTFIRSCDPEEKFQANLLLIDSSIEKIIGELLIEYYYGKNNNVEEAINKVAKRDPLQFKAEGPYRECMKRLLEASSLGMTPANKWDGQMDDTSGLIIVKRDGDIVTYPSYKRNDYRDYLLSNTRFETPSKNRHKYGKLFIKNGNVYIKLALQIRFIKPISTDEEFCES